MFPANPPQPWHVLCLGQPVPSVLLPLFSLLAGPSQGTGRKRRGASSVPNVASRSRPTTTGNRGPEKGSHGLPQTTSSHPAQTKSAQLSTTTTSQARPSPGQATKRAPKSGRAKGRGGEGKSRPRGTAGFPASWKPCRTSTDHGNFGPHCPLRCTGPLDCNHCSFVAACGGSGTGGPP